MKTARPVRTDAAQNFIRALIKNVRSHGLELPTEGAVIDRGTWEITVIAFTDRKLNPKCDGGASPTDTDWPNLDADACLSPVLDALQYAHILDDDKRIAYASTKSVYDTRGLGVYICLEESDGKSQVEGRLLRDSLAHWSL